MFNLQRKHRTYLQGYLFISPWLIGCCYSACSENGPEME